MKLSLNGQDIKGKVWIKGTAEPEYQVNVTNDKFTSAGSAGFYTYYTDAKFRDLNIK